MNYLIDILFVPEFRALSKTDGVIATKRASAWVLGEGPLQLFSEVGGLDEGRGGGREGGREGRRKIVVGYDG